MSTFGKYGLAYRDAAPLGRYRLHDQLTQIPQLNANVDNPYAHRYLELQGTNSANSDITLNTGCGIRVRTAGASADQAVITVHKDTGQSAWDGTRWQVSKEISFGCVFKTDSDVDNLIINAGFKTREAAISGGGELSTAHGNHKAILYYDSESDGGRFQFVSSIGNADTVADVPLMKVAASTTYTFGIVITPDLEPVYTIMDENQSITYKGPVIDSGNTQPYFGIEGQEAAVKTAYLREMWISRKY
jgi:hypothetical protein